MSLAKPFVISKKEVFIAWLKVKANKGSYGVDEQTIAEFEENLRDNLYKLWNRLSSGSYFPPAVRMVKIPKRNGKLRQLGIPTISDRIAQTVVRSRLEIEVEPHFHPDSYAYREGKSALDAIGVTRKRCWKYNWVLEFDIKAAFDNISHELMMKAVKHHTNCRWMILYIKRWLEAPIENSEGKQIERNIGTPQGGVISPLLFNLYLHYTFDCWMKRSFPHIPFARYADDGVLHCRSEREATILLKEVGCRLKSCSLELHPDKTRIVYCRDGNRKEIYSNIQFDFLGYTFRGRLAKSREGKYFNSFSPAISRTSAKRVRESMRKWKVSRWTDASVEDIARKVNAQLRGWWNYYGAFYPSVFKRTLSHFNVILVKWARMKFKRLNRSWNKSRKWLRRLADRESIRFYHWQLGILPEVEQ